MMLYATHTFLRLFWKSIYMLYLFHIFSWYTWKHVSLEFVKVHKLEPHWFCLNNFIYIYIYYTHTDNTEDDLKLCLPSYQLCTTGNKSSTIHYPAYTIPLWNVMVMAASCCGRLFCREKGSWFSASPDPNLIKQDLKWLLRHLPPKSTEFLPQTLDVQNDFSLSI